MIKGFTSLFDLFVRKIVDYQQHSFNSIRNLWSIRWNKACMFRFFPIKIWSNSIECEYNVYIFGKIRWMSCYNNIQLFKLDFVRLQMKFLHFPWQLLKCNLRCQPIASHHSSHAHTFCKINDRYDDSFMPLDIVDGMFAAFVSHFNCHCWMCTPPYIVRLHYGWCSCCCCRWWWQWQWNLCWFRISLNLFIFCPLEHLAYACLFGF